MRKHIIPQYTIRNIPVEVDRVLKQRAKQLGKSFNQVVVDALSAGTAQRVQPPRDLSFIQGSLTPAEAKELEQNIRSQKAIDPKLWK